MEIILKEDNDEFYFSIISDFKDGKIVRNTSELISKALGLDIIHYDEILINKVIQHKHYRIENNEIFGKGDVFFYDEGLRKEVYVERFKEVFLEELTVLALNPWFLFTF